ncbi:MAG: tRNA (adenosine(37)-N6)-threonylcarbamoyltransferase complex ATPase subunit type 1 TsaE [Candidatus Dormibacteria bacterium]
MDTSTFADRQVVRLVTSDPEETIALGRRLGRLLRPGDCLGLQGDLGAGKTTITKGIVAGAGGGDDVRSPTFLLHQVHHGRITLHHLDLYRLPSETDLSSLGLEEFLVEGAAVVEWSDRTDPWWFNAKVELRIGGEAWREVLLTLPRHLLAAARG